MVSTHIKVTFLSRSGPQVLVDGVAVNNWDGVIPREVFFIFILFAAVFNPERVGRGLTRDEIFTHIWPGLSVKDATNVFHVTKRKIAEVLSNAAGREVMLTVYPVGHKEYYLHPSIELECDVLSVAQGFMNQLVAVSAEVQLAIIEEILAKLGSELSFQESWKRSDDTALWLKLYAQRIESAIAEMLVRSAVLNVDLRGKANGIVEKAIARINKAVMLDPSLAPIATQLIGELTG